MFQELKFQLSTAILTILTLAAGVSAVINLEEQYKFRLPEDGVIWVDRAAGVQALYVPSDSPAGKAGIHQGDRLKSIGGLDIRKAVEVTQALVNVGVWQKADYLVVRSGVEVAIKGLIVGEVAVDRAVLYQYAVGFAYLIIGLFVYFRRGSAHKAQHFYILCLASFIFLTFHYTGKLNPFDKVMYFGNVAAGLLAPTIFLHFCLTFPEPRKWFQKPARLGLLYVPALLLFAVYLAVASGALIVAVPLIELRWMLDRVWLVLTVLPYLVGAFALNSEYGKAEDPIVRQQLKWLRNGAFCGILPFAVLYVLPYAAGQIPNAYQKMAVLSLPLIPLTLAYAIVRYRLMDVDIIFRRGYAYTLATICVLAAFYGIVFALGNQVQKNFKDLGNTGLITVMLIAAFLFQPIRNWIQERLDRYFYRDRYDYRRTLVEFARELSSETDLDRMLSSVGERLCETLSIKHLAFFLAEEHDGTATQFRLKKAHGLESTAARRPATRAWISASSTGSSRNPTCSSSGPAISSTRYRAPGRASVRRTIADLDLTYYLPCTVRGRIIAYMGISRTADGRLPFERGRGTAANARRLRRNRHRERQPLPVAAAQSGRVRAPEGVQREYRRVDQCGHPGGGPGRPRGELEHPDRAVERHHARACPRPEALRAVPGGAVRAVRPGLRRDRDPPHLQVRAAGRPERRRRRPTGTTAMARRPTRHVVPARFREATLNIAIAPLVSKDQERIGRLIIFDDVTDRAELEQRLVQADKLSSIGLLAAGVAHEVNTPLAVISTYAQMLAKQVADDSQKSLILDKIAKQTFRASEIVNSLLNFSRTSTTSFGEVNLNRVIQETLSLLEHQLQKAGIQLKTDLEGGLPAVQGNAGKLQQVFLNLFLNARDAMSGGGTLEVRTWSEGAGVKAEVLDSGHGIAPEHIHRIYDPFFTTKAARKGTGLGLSVTYGIIQEHGGSIEVSNRRTGGASFRLELPLAKGARKPVNAA